jgi:nucleotide-binding universal stress UspA family protein
MKKVLIAIDYNPCAQKIAETGFEYAREMDAKICIVHAIADIAYYAMEYSPVMGFQEFGLDGAFKDLKVQEKEAERFLEAVVKHLGDETIETMVLDGKTSEAILEFAKEWEANLLVIGAESHNGFEKAIMGSVVAKIVKRTEIPLLIVPTDKLQPNEVEQVSDVHRYK